MLHRNFILLNLWNDFFWLVKISETNISIIWYLFIDFLKMCLTCFHSFHKTSSESVTVTLTTKLFWKTALNCWHMILTYICSSFLLHNWIFMTDFRGITFSIQFFLKIRKSDEIFSILTEDPFNLQAEPFCRDFV